MLHVLALLALLPVMSPGGLSAGGSVGDGHGTVDGPEVSLYDFAQSPRRPTAKAQEAEDLEELTKPATVEQLDMAQPEITEPQFTAFTEMKLPQVATTGVSTSDIQSEANRGAAGTGGLTEGQGDDLWAAIAPCWRRMADETTLPVRLEVTFSQTGDLAEPPVIVRAEGLAGDSRVLVSESRAIQALAECGAYPMAGGRERVAINFPAP
ncbi:hypothetical protein ABAC460_11250 [Asticcacaulis sp. AC460]|nr:hypothetical protein ABAC460_11250 [Asticcacaulis sp. AC460]